MRYESVESLKAEIFRDLILRPSGPSARIRGPGGSRSRQKPIEPLRIGLGIAHTDKAEDYKLAVRVQDKSLMADEKLLSKIEERASGEVDVAFIGELTAYNRLPNGTPMAVHIRPLAIGSSIAHNTLTAGSIGLFPWSADKTRRLILSNYHVLKNFKNTPSPAIYQPGPYDNGGPADTVGNLLDFYEIDLKGGPNYIDAAIADIAPGVCVIPNEVTPPGLLQKFSITKVGDVPKVGLITKRSKKKVHKLGSTTCFTTGYVRSERVDHVTINYGNGLRGLFHRSMEVVGEDPRVPFSAGGDSGSVIFDEDGIAFGLLFGGGLLRPRYSPWRVMDVTYANDLTVVFSDLKLSMDIC